MNPIPDPSPSRDGFPESFDPPPGSGQDKGPKVQVLKLIPPYVRGEAIERVERDERFHRLLFFGLIFCYLLAGLDIFPGRPLWSMAGWMVLIGWLILGFNQAALWQEMARSSQLIDTHPQLAEHLLVDVSKKSLMPGAVRSNFYYRLALLRFKQQRFAESAAICDDLIVMDHKTLGQFKANILLVRTECALRLNDLASAYQGLNLLYPMQVTLLESLQRLLLRTLYESKSGRHDYVVDQWKQKVINADLMPQPQCRLMHDLLAASARVSHLPDLAQWLTRRGKLLGEPVI